MDTIIAFIIEISRLIGKKFAKFLNFDDVNEETETIIGIIFTVTIIAIIIAVLVLS